MDNDELENIDELQSVADQIGIDIDIKEKIGQSGPDWMLDFMIGIKCGIAAQNKLASIL